MPRYNFMKNFSIQLRALVACSIVVASGCSSTRTASIASSTVPATRTVSGRMTGGQQPVAGATVTLYSVGQTGDGSAGISQMTSAVLTDSLGQFNMTGFYTCPTPTASFPGYVFLTGTGGNPGLGAGIVNRQSTFVAGIGLCSSVSASTFVQLNELTTVGTVAALHSFMTGPTRIGSSASDAAALASAMALIGQYTDLAAGTVPGPALPAGSYASSTEIRTLADAMASCVNSSGGVAGDGSACGTIFTAATPPAGVAPTDTVTAMLNVVNNPTNNVSSIFNSVPAQAPFQPTLPTSPSAWSLPIGAPTSAGSFSFASPTYSVNENGGSVAVTVNRTGGSAGSVSVNCGTTDLVALGGFQYTTTLQTLTWAAGDATSRTVTIPITDVGLTSGSTTFNVSLATATGGAVLGSPNFTTVTIINNDPSALKFIVAASVTVNENAGTATVGIKRQGNVPSGTTATVQWSTVPGIGLPGSAATYPLVQPAIAGVDYTASRGTLTWTNTSPLIQNVTVPIIDHGLTAGSTAFLVELSNPSAGWQLGEYSYGRVTIVGSDSNPGALGLLSSTATVNQDAGAVEMAVTRTGGAAGVAQVSFATTDRTAVAGTDYTSTSGTLTWAAGDATSRFITVPITAQQVNSGSVTFSVALSGASGAVLGTTTAGTVTITKNYSSPGSLSLSAGSYSVNENAGNVVIQVPRAGGTTGAASVTYSTTNGTGAAGTDYASTSGTLNWASGDSTSKSIVVPVVDQHATSGTKTFNVLLGVVSGAKFSAPTSAIVTINDNDIAGTAGSLQLSSNSYTTTEQSGAVGLSVSRTGGSTGPVTLNYASADYSAIAGIDYAATSGTLTWASGDTSTKTISTAVNDVHVYSGTRTFYVALSNPTGGAVLGVNQAASIAISENDSILYPNTDPFANITDVSYSNYTDPVTKTAVTYRWGQFPANDFGPDPVAFQTNLSMTQLSSLPAPGVHPRLLFTAADLPAIQNRMSNTTSGKLIWNKILAYSAGLHGTYDGTAAYAIPDILQGGYQGSHGNTFIRGYTDPTSLWYPQNRTLANLAAGVQPVSVSTGADLNTTTLWPMFAYEALRCVLQNDTAGGQTLAAAATFEMVNEQAARTASGKARPYTSAIGTGNGGFYFAYVYDFLYNFMTSAQQAQWTAELVNTSSAADNYGTLNAATSTRSNWSTFTYWHPGPVNLYGQTGYNAIKVAGLQRGMQNFMNYGILPSGAFEEGEAKDQLGADGLLMLARLGGQNLFQDPHLQAYVHNFLPASVVPNPAYKSPLAPYGTGPFLRYDLLGGLEQINTLDMSTLHYMFPTDSVVDWLYQTEFGPNYEYITQGNGTTGDTAYADDLINGFVTLTDFNPANANPANLNLPLTFFGGDRGLMITRSDWASTDAMMLNMHTRQANGGHPMDDRNSIFLFGKGRAWSAINFENFNQTYQSVVNIDANATIPPIQNVLTPGRIVDFQDQPLATFSVGDASYTWAWSEAQPQGRVYTPAELAAGNFVMPRGSTFEPHSKNDFGYTKIVSDEMNTPLSQSPSWITYTGTIWPVTRSPNFPVIKAFRSTGLVRGPSTGVSPYGLVVDDIQVSTTAVHHYDWQMLLENDLAIVSVNQLQGSQGVWDITLASNGVANPGDPVLLIRVLDLKYDAAATVTQPYILAPSATNLRADTKRPLLIIPNDSISPNYKVLLFPYRLGDVVPLTTWDQSHTALTIGMPTYSDVVTFTPAASGKTDINITRGASTLINLNTPIAPFQ